jgi:RNA polymerase sigma-70 factor, ECF subfamily
VEPTHAQNGPDGARAKFADVFLPHLDAAYQLARWLMHHDQDAQDCVQEAYLRAFRAYPRFRGGDGKAWFMTIVRNVCYTAIKKRPGYESAEPFDEEVHQPAYEGGEQKATAETLQSAIEQLPPEHREMIILHDLEGHAYKEIAAIASLPIGTVMSRLSRARDKLRALLNTSSGATP